jgi:hypothetical protein
MKNGAAALALVVTAVAETVTAVVVGAATVA